VITRRDAILALTAAIHRPYPPASLRLNIATRQITAVDWPDPAARISLGSLMKPFVALAFGAAHNFQYPEVNCKRCWKPDGHGRISLIDAVAGSCNSYFLELARGCSLDGVARVATTYGLNSPTSAKPESWIGLAEGWHVEPTDLLGAFAELTWRAAEKGPQLLLHGMREASRRGTAKAIEASAYAKTGTGPCTHTKGGTGDGFVIALYPAGAPKHALLVRLHDQPGSEAARAAGVLIRSTS
jgi:cell division protein FtsI/penicillin-binding protein 2